MTERDYQILEHIKKHCDDIDDFLDRSDLDFETFERDNLYYNAITMSLMQIGELVKNFSNDFVEDTNDNIPWKKIKGFRDIVAHGYDSLDKDKVWNVIINDIDPLTDFCRHKIKAYKSRNLM